MSNDILTEAERLIDQHGTQEQKKTLKKVTGLVKGYERAPWRKFIGMFFEEDFGTVLKYLVSDVIKPRGKDFLAEMFIAGIERAIYGDGSVPPSSRSSLSGQKNYSTSSVLKSSTPSTSQSPKFSFDDVVMQDRAAAQDLLDTLRGAIAKYGYVKVSELYDILDSPKLSDFTDNYWGWKDLSNVPIIRLFGGKYTLGLPKPIPIE